VRLLRVRGQPQGHVEVYSSLMGQAILYCYQCQTQLRSQDFEKGKAFSFDDKVSCLKCAPEVLKSLPREAPKATPKPFAQAESTSPSKLSDSRRIALPSLTPPSGRPALREERRPPIALYGGLGVGAVALILGVLWIGGGSSSGRRPPEPPDAAPTPPVARMPTPPAVAVPAPRPTAPPVVPVPPSAGSSESLSKARAYVLGNPADLAGQIELYERARVELSGSAGFDEASRELVALKNAVPERIASELRAVDERTRAFAAKEDFGRALGTLEESRTRLLHPDWARAIQSRAEDLGRDIATLFATQKGAALEAKRRGAVDDVRLAQERVTRWGLEAYPAELGKALAEVAPPLSPAAAAYAKCWEGAARSLRGRDGEAAAAALKAGLEGLKEAELRKESAQDLELFTVAGTLLKEALQLLPKFQRGQHVALDFEGIEGGIDRVEGAVVRIDPYRVEVKSSADGRIEVIPFGEVRAATLAHLLREARGKVTPPEARALAVGCLLDGQPEAARTLLQGQESPLPEKYWEYARSVVAAHARSGGDLFAREREARAIFAAAERLCDSPVTAAEAAQKEALLLKTFGDTAFVARNRSYLIFRSQGGKDFYFFPEDMAAQGGFTLVKNSKTESCFSSDSDLEPARLGDRFVEVAFSPLPATEYRLWVLAGGCCAETFAFSYQATELAGPPSKDSKEPVHFEPESGFFMPVKLPFLSSLKKTHASHNGPKAPARWEWIAVPLPRYSAGGPKKIRFLSLQKGFSIAGVLVTAQRTAPPSEPEVRGFEKLRLDTPGAGALVRGVPKTSPRILITDFERDPEGWTFNLGWEFAGAKGCLNLDTAQAHRGKRSYRLEGDFTGGGAYVGTWMDFKVLKEKDFQEIRLWVKTTSVKNVGIRVGDTTGQCHQANLALAPTSDWQELVLTFDALVGREHWGGANDGKWHGPPTGFGINLGKTSFAPGVLGGSLWIDDVEGILSRDHR